jgi:hypothetical protein
MGFKMTLTEMQAELNRVNLQIEALKPAKVVYSSSAKIMRKIKNTKLHAKTAHKYFDLQAAYMASIRG